MNPNFDVVIQADIKDREGLFVETANRLNTIPHHVEKDFWVCWTLDALFHGRPHGDHRLLFKGGTSLSKGFGLINRFSEDIDVTVFRTDIGYTMSTMDMQELSRKKRDAMLDAIREDCGTYIRGAFLDNLKTRAATAMASAGIPDTAWRIEVSPDDDQSLHFWYPVAIRANADDPYVKQRVLIESGAKSALEPHVLSDIAPYSANEMAGLDLSVKGVTTADPRRTFWDKIIVAHGQRQWFERKGEMKGGGQRLTRHYYDLHHLLNSPVGEEALTDLELGLDVTRHARTFFNRPPYGLDLAEPGSFTLAPSVHMLDALRADYADMAVMVFGEAPAFEEVIRSVEEIEAAVNSPGGLTP